MDENIRSKRNRIFEDLGRKNSFTADIKKFLIPILISGRHHILLKGDYSKDINISIVASFRFFTSAPVPRSFAVRPLVVASAIDDDDNRRDSHPTSKNRSARRNA